MAIFDEQLSPEEQLGFSVDEVDNESFILNAFGGEYPGTVPDYDPSSFITATVADSELKDINAESEIVNNNNIKEVASDEDINDVFGMIDDIDDAIVGRYNQTADDFGDLSNENKQLAEDYEDLVNKSADLDNENISGAAESGKIAFDDEFLRQLQEDIEQRATRIADKPADKDDNSSADNVIFGSGSAPDLDQGDETLNADLITMEIENSSNSKNIAEDSTSNSEVDAENLEDNKDYLEDISNENVEEAEYSVNLSEDIENLDEKTEEIEVDINENAADADNSINKNYKNNENIKKGIKMSDNEAKNSNPSAKMDKKKTIFLIAAIAVLAALLIIGGVIVFLYISSDNSEDKAAAMKTEATDSLNLTVKKDSVDLSKEGISFGDSTVNKDSKSDSLSTDSLNLAKDSLRLALENENRIKDSINQAELNKNKINNANKTPNLASKRRNNNVNRNNATTKNNSTVTAVYSIQIYSSPSKSDAEVRLNLLKQKGINGVISTQQVKGNTWYRVRFGGYATYEEALAAANKFGFGDAWIERIK